MSTYKPSKTIHDQTSQHVLPEKSRIYLSTSSCRLPAYNFQTTGTASVVFFWPILPAHSGYALLSLCGHLDPKRHPSVRSSELSANSGAQSNTLCDRDGGARRDRRARGIRKFLTCFEKLRGCCVLFWPLVLCGVTETIRRRR